jgi:peptidoglycan/xylan/chitin deacetylase (PgdA/CDA1 family)
MKFSFNAVLVALVGVVTNGVFASPAIHHSHIARAPTLATVYTKCTKPNTVALTFDDGPYLYIYDIVRTLNAAGAKGTFFFNGNNYGCIYDTNNQKRIKYAYNNGHQVASHTWAHLHLSTLSWDKIHDEMWRVEQAFQRILGVSPAFMRPPYGEYNDLVRQASAVRNQSLVIWDFDSGDSVGATASESKKMYDDIARKHPSTILALNHETSSSTAFDVLPHALDVLKNKGYKFVTVAECVGDKKPYTSVKTPPAADPSWHC